MDLFQLQWDDGRYHLYVNIYQDGTLTWGYRDRNELIGMAEEGPTKLPEEFFDKLKSLF